MKLQAVTICVNYSDFLIATIENRKHFDRWIVVTARDDAATIDVCCHHGVEYLQSGSITSAGSDFNVKWRKAPLINEGLDRLDQDGWFVIVDADTLLPSYFRRRISAMELDGRCLYGLKGRRVCLDREEFNHLRFCEPWSFAVRYNSQPVGYFNLFHSDSRVNRYIVDADWSRDLLDDDIFAEAYPADCRRLLPMIGLHAGFPERNWFGRVSPFYGVGGGAREVIPDDLAANLKALRKESLTAVIIGCFPNGGWQKIAVESDKVLLVDYHRLFESIDGAAVDADHSVLRALLEEQMNKLPPYSVLPAHSVRWIEELPPRSIGVVYISNDALEDWFLHAFEVWLPKLREDAVICGECFGVPGFDAISMLVTAFLGSPKHVGEDGFWWATTDYSQKAMCLKSRNGDSRTQKVVIVSSGCEHEALFLTLFSAADSWGGAIEVVHWGGGDIPIRLACHIVGAAFRLISIEEANLPDGRKSVHLMEEVSKWYSPGETLVLAPGMLIVKSLLFQDLVGCREQRGTVEDSIRPIYMESVGLTRTIISEDAAVHATDYCAGSGATVVVCDGDPINWAEDAWSAWSERKFYLIDRLQVAIRTSGALSVVVIVSYETLAEFEQSWAGWRFQATVDTLIVLVGLKAADVWWPGEKQPRLCLEVETNMFEGAQALINCILAQTLYDRVMILPATARALPGAELACGARWDSCDAVFVTPELASLEFQVSGNRFVLEDCFCYFVKSKTIEGMLCPLDSHIIHLSTFLRVAIERVDCRIMDVPPRSWGWEVNEVYRYVPTDFLWRGRILGRASQALHTAGVAMSAPLCTH